MMSEGRETTFKIRVLKDLAALPRCYAIKIQQRSRRGDADVVGCLSGHFFVLELKRDEYEQADPLQTHKLTKWRNAGGIAFVTFPRNWPSVLEELKRRCRGGLPNIGTDGHSESGS